MSRSLPTDPTTGPPTGPSHPTSDAEPLPPVRRSVTVRCAQDRAFDVFTRRIGAWWPVASHSLGGETVASLDVEPAVGGRVVETWTTGERRTWGTVLAWEPPQRFAMTWEITPVATELELRFFALGPELTRVDLEHRGWQRLAVLVDRRERYAGGWEFVLGCFERGVEAARAAR